MDIKKLYADNKLHIQVENYTCGPCSLLNILRLKGQADHTEGELAKLCHAKPGEGTENEDLVAAASQLELTIVEEKSNAAIEDIEKHLDAGNFVIVNYTLAFHHSGHYALVAQHDDHALYFFDSEMGLMRLKKKYFLPYWINGEKTLKRWFVAIQ